MNTLKIGDTKIICEFDVSVIQSELDGIIVACKLMGNEVEIKEYSCHCTVNIYKSGNMIDYCYIVFNYSDKQTHNAFNTVVFQNEMLRPRLCRNGIDLIDCIAKLKKIVMEGA